MKLINFKNYFFVLFTTIVISGCGSLNLNVFSNADEVSLGQELSAEINTNTKEYPPYTGDPSVERYIEQEIFLPILSSKEITKKNVYKYELHLVDNDSVMNAFALPGGPIYIYTGLLKYLDSEAALAGVIAHEIAHCERRHATQRLTKYYGVSILMNFILGDNPSQITEIATNLFVGLGFLANSRSDENEADEYSFKYLRGTRFYPGGVKFFFEKMKEDGLVSGNSGSIETYLSTHPAPIDRISTTENRLRDNNIPVKHYTDTGEGIFKQEYKKNILQKLR